MKVFFIILIVVGVILSIIAMIREDKNKSSFILAYTSGWILSIAVFSWSNADRITPMDVYQGKTTLRITYQDSIPVDSCVVWKKDINH